VFIVLLINLLTVLIGLYFAKYPLNMNILHPKKIFIYFYLLVQVSGFFFALIIFFLVGEYKISTYTLFNISLLTLYGLIIFLFFYYFFSKSKIFVQFFYSIKLPVLKSNVFKKVYLIFFIIGLLGLLIYYLKNGFVFFKEGGYENKNLANVGLGYARIMYGVGLSYGIAAFLLFSFNKFRFKVSLLISLILGVLIFLIIGGGRAASLGLFIEVLIIALYYNRINEKKIFILGIGLFFLIVLLTIIRYKVSLSSETLSLILYQLQGSFSPIDSFAKIIEVMPFQFDFRQDLFFNSFLTLIPRFIWENKPLDIQVPSVFFTNEILNYKSFLTISPTLLGELYIYGGMLGVTIGMFIVAFFVRLMTIIYIKSFKLASYRLFFIFNALVYFSLMREGVSIFLRDLFMKLFIFSFIVLFIYILYFNAKKDKR